MPQTRFHNDVHPITHQPMAGYVHAPLLHIAPYAFHTYLKPREGFSPPYDRSKLEAWLLTHGEQSAAAIAEGLGIAERRVDVMMLRLMAAGEVARSKRPVDHPVEKGKHHTRYLYRLVGNNALN